MILFQINFQTVIIMKLVVSFIYLAVNYITHKFQLPISLANVLRLFISCLDFVILLALMFHYVWEWCVMAYGYSIIGILLSIFLCALNWAILVRQDDKVQPVFIIGTFCLIVLLVLYCQFISMGLGYKGLISALFMFNGIYISCWLIFDPYAKTITRFMEYIGDHLSWIDPLIGGMSRKEVALRNLCSFNLGLLNLTYIHASGGANFVILISVGLGLLINVLIGLRLIKVSASITLKHGFMVQVIKHGYSNIAQIYEQFKKGQLPKATWYAWAMVLTIGLVFTSPSYAMPPYVNEERVSMSSPFLIDEESQNQEVFETADSGEPLGESNWGRSARYAKEFLEHNVNETLKKVKSAPADFLYGAAKTGAVATVGAVGKGAYDYWHSSGGEMPPETRGEIEQNDSNQPSTSGYAQLLKANADKDKTISDQASTIKNQSSTIERQRATIEALQKKASWSAWFESCWKGSSSE